MSIIIDRERDNMQQVEYNTATRVSWGERIDQEMGRLFEIALNHHATLRSLEVRMLGGVPMPPDEPMSNVEARPPFLEETFNRIVAIQESLNDSVAIAERLRRELGA